jgi:hypothetical protein
MEVEALLKQVEQLQARLQLVEDENAVEKLETAYAYFLEHLMVDEIVDCWVDGGSLVWVGLGVFLDKPAIRKVWETVKEHFGAKGETRHMGPRISPYISIAPDGKTASARWYVAGTPLGAGMLCENTYVKDNGVWKINVMEVGAFPLDPSTLAAQAASAMSALGAEAASAAMNEASDRPPMTLEQEEAMTQEYMSGYPFTERIPRTPRQEWGPYLRPFSFKHPVTGKDLNVTVAAHNAAHPCPMPPGGEKWTEGQA